MLFDQAIDIPEVFTSEELAVSVLDEMARFSLRIKAKDLTEFKKITGLKLPKNIGQSTSVKTILSFCLGPDEWLVITPISQKNDLSKKLSKASATIVCSVTEVSHRNVGFNISGKKSAELINVGCPQDLSLEKFPVSKVTRSVFESASIILFRSEETTFHMECWRSFSPYIRDYFKRVMVTK